MMRFVFTTRFFLLLAIGFIILSLGWQVQPAIYAAVVFDILLIAVAIADYFLSEKPSEFRVERQVDDRFSMGAINQVTIKVTNRSGRPITYLVKDEYPPPMRLDGDREMELHVQHKHSGT